MWLDLARAMALVLVFEGIAPFVMPQGWRRTILRVATFNDRALRFVGLTSMTAGIIILQLTRR